MYDYDADNFNFMLINKDNVHLPDDTDLPENYGDLIISGLKNILTERKKVEDGSDKDTNINYDPTKPQAKIDNTSVKTIDLNKIKQQIDDLQELLNNSNAFAEAKYLSNFGKYVDKNFPADANSIYGFGERRDYSLEQLKQLPWLRPKEFFQGKPFRVYDKIESNDIEQGGLGDCYFLAAISSIAEYP